MILADFLGQVRYSRDESTPFYYARAICDVIRSARYAFGASDRLQNRHARISDSRTLAHGQQSLYNSRDRIKTLIDYDLVAVENSIFPRYVTRDYLEYDFTA